MKASGNWVEALDSGACRRILIQLGIVSKGWRQEWRHSLATVIGSGVNDEDSNVARRAGIAGLDDGVEGTGYKYLAAAEQHAAVFIWSCPLIG